MNSASKLRSPAQSGDPCCREELLSGWLDGEAHPHECSAMLDELLAGEALRRKAAEWSICGDALRSHETVTDPSPGHSRRVCERIARALEAEPALLAPSALQPRHMARRIAGGLAIAAAVAVLAVVVVPQVRTNAGQAVVAASGGARPATLVAGTAPGAARARAARSPDGEAPDPSLDPYFLAHGNYASGVMPAAAVYLRHGPDDR